MLSPILLMSLDSKTTVVLEATISFGSLIEGIEPQTRHMDHQAQYSQVLKHLETGLIAPVTCTCCRCRQAGPIVCCNKHFNRVEA